jgi:hypothetical protein
MAERPTIVIDLKCLDAPDKHHAGMLRAWHLAMLRFAVTRDNADRLGVFAIANGIDRLGGDGAETPRFGFFRRMSVGLCVSIVQRSEADDTELRQYLARIEDIRLRRTLAAAIEIDQPEAAVARSRRRAEDNLWSGLAPRVALRR